MQKKFERQEQQRVIEIEQAKRDVEDMKENIKKEIWLDIEKQMGEMIDKKEIVVNLTPK